MDKNLKEMWQKVLEGLYNAAKERIEDELSNGLGVCETMTIDAESNYIENLTLLSDKIDEDDEEDLSPYTKFIKDDEVDREEFKQNMMIRFGDLDEDEDENVEAIVSTIFDN